MKHSLDSTLFFFSFLLFGHPYSSIMYHRVNHKSINLKESLLMVSHEKIAFKMHRRGTNKKAEGIPLASYKTFCILEFGINLIMVFGAWFFPLMVSVLFLSGTLTLSNG